MEKKGLYNEPTFVDSFKGKLVDVASDYFKRKIETSKNDVMKYVEKIIEKKIKKEIRRYTYTAMAMVIGGLGVGILVFGLISMIIYLLELPQFLSSIIFGCLLLITSLIIYLIR